MNQKIEILISAFFLRAFISQSFARTSRYGEKIPVIFLKLKYLQFYKGINIQKIEIAINFTKTL